VEFSDMTGNPDPALIRLSNVQADGVLYSLLKELVVKFDLNTGGYRSSVG
jgi:hypothetical protein